MTASSERLKSVVVSTLEIPGDQYRADLEYRSIEAWDSLAQVNLIFAIEEEFNVQFGSDEIQDLTSIPKILQALGAKGF